MSLSFKVDNGIVEAIKELAGKENRSLSNYVITLLMKHLEEQGVEWRKEKKAKK